MKILIVTPHTSPSEIKKDAAPYATIIEKKGHKVNVVSTRQKSGDDDYAVSISNEIKNADAVIVPPSIVGIELGGIISLALQHRKSTMLVYNDTKPESILFSATHLITMIKFDGKDTDSLEAEFKPFFTDVRKKKLLYRFNLMLSREMNAFLSSRSREQGVSKADYVRQLVLKDMGQSEE